MNKKELDEIKKNLRDSLIIEVVKEERNKLLNQANKNHHKKIGSIIDKILEKLPDEN
jgi:hypothetical protein